MNARNPIFIIAAAALLAMPLAAAEWRGRGFYEPDTARDVLDGRMFTDPDTELAGKKVYFSGFVGQSAYAATSNNPNVGLLGSQYMPYPTVTHAFLGVWKDCNEDGYIGLPESPFMGSTVNLTSSTSTNVTGATTAEDATVANPVIHSDGAYSSLLLLTTAVCPVGGDFNDGTMVREFHGIVPGASGKINDPDARVWADYGVPEDSAKASCPVNPRPRGTYQSTGGFLRYSDCMTNWRVTGAINDVAALTGLGELSFADAPKERPDQSDSLLNRPNPWGQPGADPIVTTWDCSKRAVVPDPTGGQQFVVTDPTGGQLSAVFGSDGQIAFNVSDGSGIPVAWTPSVGAPNPSGSPAATVNHTESGLSDCSTQERPNCGDFIFVGADQHTGGDIYCLEEADFEATTPRRTQTDYWYSPSFNYYWFGQPSFVVSRNPYINRDDLSPWGGVYVTFYASVGDATLSTFSLPTSATGIYGSHHCLGLTELTGGFHCDGDKWYRGPAGEDIANQWQVRVGKTYQLMDVDCYDASVRGVPVSTGAVAGIPVGATQCARPE